MFYPFTMRRFKVKFRESCATILLIILGNKGIYVPEFPNNQITIETNGIYYLVIQSYASRDF